MTASEMLAFTPEQVQRLTGLSVRQLAYWDRTNFFRPAHTEERPRSPYSRVYSFRDVVGLRTLAVIRKAHKVPLQQLRKVGAYLTERYGQPWSELSFYIVGRQVYYRQDDAVRRADETGQTVSTFAIRQVEERVRDMAERLRHRSARDLGRISRHRHVAENQAVVAGTRVPVSAIRDFYQAGYSHEAILHEFPVLAREDIEAALQYETKKAKTA